MRIAILSCLLTLISSVALAQIQTAPMEDARVPSESSDAPPPVLPSKPRRPAIEAATQSVDGVCYAGPSGAMNTSLSGSACAVTCGTKPQIEQYKTNCSLGQTALCQCDTEPYATCITR